MAKKATTIKEKDFKRIIKILPFREQKSWIREEIQAEDLKDRIQKGKETMKLDVYFGIPWFLLYAISLAVGGLNYLTIIIFVIGLVYFTYRFFKNGSYGMNRKRIKVCEELLEILEPK